MEQDHDNDVRVTWQQLMITDLKATTAGGAVERIEETTLACFSSLAGRLVRLGRLTILGICVEVEWLSNQLINMPAVLYLPVSINPHLI